MRAYVGMGSNLQDPVAQLQQAARALQALPQTRLLAVSPYYRNPPMGSVAQPDYVNAVAALETSLDAPRLLDLLLMIENQQGRVRDGKRWGPRSLDLDLLLFGDNVITTPHLTVPHPGLPERNFVLYPLYDVAPQLVIPGHGQIRDLVAQCSAEGLERLDLS